MWALFEPPGDAGIDGGFWIEFLGKKAVFSGFWGFWDPTMCRISPLDPCRTLKPVCGGGVVETPLSQYTPCRPLSVEFRVIRVISRVPGYTVVFGWVFVVNFGFFRHFWGFWVILSSRTMPCSRAGRVRRVFSGHFWVISRSSGSPHAVRTPEMGLLGRLMVSWVASRGAGTVGDLGMGFLRDLWSKKWFFWVFLGFWVFFVVQTDRRDELAGW